MKRFFHLYNSPTQDRAQESAIGTSDSPPEGSLNTAALDSQSLLMTQTIEAVKWLRREGKLSKVSGEACVTVPHSLCAIGREEWTH